MYCFETTETSTIYVSKHLNHLKYPKLFKFDLSYNIVKLVYMIRIYIFEIECELDFYTLFDLSYLITTLYCISIPDLSY